jgi:hypothetical protein
MHQCLQIVEIVSLICSNVDNQFPPTPQRCAARNLLDLAALARTCTMFREPALNTLWREQYSLAPFLNLMPDNLFESSKGRLYDRRWVSHIVTVWHLRIILPHLTCPLVQRLSRPIVATDWSRAPVYTSRVKELFLPIGISKNFRTSYQHSTYAARTVSYSLTFGLPDSHYFIQHQSESSFLPHWKRFRYLASRLTPVFPSFPRFRICARD